MPFRGVYGTYWQWQISPLLNQSHSKIHRQGQAVLNLVKSHRTARHHFHSIKTSRTLCLPLFIPLPLCKQHSLLQVHSIPLAASFLVLLLLRKVGSRSDGVFSINTSFSTLQILLPARLEAVSKIHRLYTVGWKMPLGKIALP